MSSRRYPLIGFACILAYLALGWALRGNLAARSIFGHASLVATAALVVGAIWWRRRAWVGAQRLFWDIIGIGVGLWIVGHFGWAFDDLLFAGPPWVQWHTVFSLSGTIAPLIALLARPHRGTRSDAAATVAVDLAAFGLLAVFVYSYFILVPSLAPGAQAAGQRALFGLVQINRGLLFAALLATIWFARRTDWRPTYVRLAIGAGIGLFVRSALNLAVTRGDYYPGSIYDLAWIFPWLCYAWAVIEAPASTPAEHGIEAARDAPTSVAFSAVPVLLIPVIGYGLLPLDPLAPPGDSFRALLTSVTTVGGLALLTIRLATQRMALQRADARVRLLAAATEQTADLILITRADGGFQHANEAFVRALGYSRRELRDLGHAALLGNDLGRLGKEIPDAVRRHGIWRGTLLRRRKDGSTFPSACSVSALRQGGAITHYVAVERDVSEEIRLRDQLVHGERLSAIGELVAGVAHEINNPLQTIIGSVELMMEDRTGTVDRRDLEVVRREAARAGQIVRNLLAFIRRGSQDRVAADLTQIVRSTVELREYHLRQSNVSIDASYAPEPLMVLVNREEVQQVVLNLLLNAEHAILAAGRPGSISVRTAAEGSRHVVEIADTGPGISPDLRGRIFEPFFTTKDVGEGTGLGLSISHGIASAHGGALELRESAAGARFCLSLPAHPDGFRRVDAGEPKDVESPAVLVVDDEPGIRQLLVRLLERRGFAVDQAATGDEALRLTADRRYRVIVCDVRMPGLGGVELYHRLRTADAEMRGRFVLMTGDAARLEAGQVDTGDAAVLAKPFTAADLDAVLARLLGRSFLPPGPALGL